MANVGAETLDQLFDDLRRLIVIYNQQPLPTLLGDLVDTQDRTFVLLEGHQRPDQARDLYLVAGITCGLMAMASRDLGATHDAMTRPARVMPARTMPAMTGCAPGSAACKRTSPTTPGAGTMRCAMPSSAPSLRSAAAAPRRYCWPAAKHAHWAR
ncbi:MAG: hypothetical protein ACRDRH_20435 [Pseudonocardia sp.]